MCKLGGPLSSRTEILPHQVFPPAGTASWCPWSSLPSPSCPSLSLATHYRKPFKGDSCAESASLMLNQFLQLPPSENKIIWFTEQCPSFAEYMKTEEGDARDGVLSFLHVINIEFLCPHFIILATIFFTFLLLKWGRRLKVT